MHYLEQLKPPVIGPHRGPSSSRPTPRVGADHRSRLPAGSAWLGAVLATAIGLALGALTFEGQSQLPRFAGSLANSAGSWVLAAFLVALTGSSVWQSVIRGSACLVALDAGYYVTASTRGIPVSAGIVIFWVLAAVVFGPIVGLAAGWVRHRGRVKAAVGAGTLAGFLAGESLYALHYLHQSTSSAYWTIQLIVAGGLGVWLAWRRSRWLPSVFVSALACTVVASVVYVVELRG